MNYIPPKNRHENLIYRKTGRSGLQMPALSLGLWQNFGRDMAYQSQREMILKAFDSGLASYDLAIGYCGGASEECLGRVLREDLMPYREELIIATKGGHPGFPGPNGRGGSRKMFLGAIEISLRRLGIEYVDIYYHHAPDPKTPLEETVSALSQIVRQGKAVYIGISNYSADDTKKIAAMLKAEGTPLLVHQHQYSMFHRNSEVELHPLLEELGVGGVAYSPLAQGLLTDKYLDGIPAGSRAEKNGSLKPESITADKIDKLKKLSKIAESCGTSMTGLAIAWALRKPMMATVLLGVSRVAHIEDGASQFLKAKVDDIIISQIETVLNNNG